MAFNPLRHNIQRLLGWLVWSKWAAKRLRLPGSHKESSWTKFKEHQHQVARCGWDENSATICHGQLPTKWAKKCLPSLLTSLPFQHSQRSLWKEQCGFPIPWCSEDYGAYPWNVQGHWNPPRKQAYWPSSWSQIFQLYLDKLVGYCQWPRRARRSNTELAWKFQKSWTHFYTKMTRLSNSKHEQKLQTKCYHLATLEC